MTNESRKTWTLIPAAEGRHTMYTRAMKVPIYREVEAAYRTSEVACDQVNELAGAMEAMEREGNVREEQRESFLAFQANSIALMISADSCREVFMKLGE